MRRDPEYVPDICNKLLPLFKDGSTVVEVCQALSITRKTYYQWKKEYNDFCEAADFAEEAAEAKLEMLGRKALFSNGKIKIDTSLYSFIMKNRFVCWGTGANPIFAEAEKAQPLSIYFNVSPAVGEVTVTNANTKNDNRNLNRKAGLAII
ncbi:helix-turn-helix domain-containing protein [Legionella septentrionalis]|uniref:Helix-turn-helix domain-containing protein n=1 Tax=Legionella septentrionalis TaxID=2498109 RepID=A0A3S0XFM9_9GAMM|nr:helix-turn-helix domain-containing protein [Legionella septentrionalis]RUQ84477.1 helix-turn-helix domain-containing protein [Legionella septentrionalis]